MTVCAYHTKCYIGSQQHFTYQGDFNDVYRVRCWSFCGKNGLAGQEWQNQEEDLSICSCACHDNHRQGSIRSGKKETVTVNGLEYFFGETAVHEVGSIAVTGLHDRWLEMPEFQALVQGAINIVKDDTGVVHSVTAGLPPSIFSDQNLKLRNIISLCTDAEVRVHQEPAGVAMQNRLDESGIMIPDSTGDLGVVAIGRYTTDFMAMLDGRWVQGAAGSARGMSRAANLVMRKLNEQGYKIDYLDADDALWKKSIKYNGANNDVTPVVEIALHVLASEIFDATSNKFGDTGRKMEKYWWLAVELV